MRTGGQVYLYWATPATGEPVSTSCTAEAPGEIPHPSLSACMQTTVGAGFYTLPRLELNGATSTYGDTRMISATPTQLCATPQRGATMECLCAPPGSLASPVTRVVDGLTLVENFAGGPLHVVVVVIVVY